MKKVLISLIAVSILSAASTAMALTPDEGVAHLQKRWAKIQYQLPEDEKDTAFEALEADAARMLVLHPESAELHTWHGIVLSTWAGARGGLGALGLAKKARAEFDRAIELDDKALDGSAHTSLGALYDEVPGWPIGFGSDKRAEKHLKMGLALNPDGIDSNYFYGTFLMHEKRWDEAVALFEKAAKARPRPGREVADAGRRDEINSALQNARAKVR